MNELGYKLAILEHLRQLNGIASLKKLICTDLNYDHRDIELPPEAAGIVQGLTCTAPRLLATGGQDGEFHVIFIHLIADRLSIVAERRIINKLLQTHPYSLFVFSNHGHDDWHFINVKHDSDIKRRKLFRRIRISPHEQLRTAAERLSMIDMEEIQKKYSSPGAFDIQTVHDEAFDVEKVTEDFFEKYKQVFQQVEASITGLAEKEILRLFTQKLFNRLMFIAFIQKKGWLKFNGSTDYLNSLWMDYKRKRTDGNNFYLDRLHLLFFAGLNNSGNINIPAINHEGVLNSLIGEVPYLNGGLFEKEEDDSAPSIIIPDQCFELIFTDLFSAFNFTVMESTPLDVEVAVDPEMLGKIFERLVTGRHESGSYYTPKPVVSFMCREALKGYLGNHHNLVDKHSDIGISVSEAKVLLEKMATIKICDPACGSGAYLVGMLHELHQIMSILDTRSAEATARDNYHLKLDIIQNNLYGVDLDPFAVNIARLRLWLTLAVEYDGNKPEPLPNLDFKLEIGDSLSAPNPIQASQQAIIGELAKKLKNKTSAYMRNHHYGEKASLKTEIEILHNEIRSWLHAGEQIAGFDWAVEFADVFSSGGFDVILANPPYGITCEDPLRFQYFPRIKGEDLQSKDSYGLFVARGLQLLKSGGFLTFIISDTWRTIRSHRSLRKRLSQETCVMHVLDLPSWIFDATVNTGILSAVKIVPSQVHQLIAGDLRNLPKGDWATLEQNLTAISGRGPDCSTTTYARYTYPQALIATYDNFSFFIGSPKLYKLMSDAKLPRLGDIGAAVHGISTGDNRKYIRKEEYASGTYPLIEEWMKVPTNEIANFTDEEKTNGINRDWRKLCGCFVPFEKGGESEATEGWLPNYYVPTNYYINWASGAIRDMKKNLGARFFNERYFFKHGLTFSISGVYAPTFRLNSSGVFEAKGSCIFINTLSPELLLGLLCSKFARYEFKSYIKHTIDTSGDDINEFRFPIPNEHTFKLIEALVSNIIAMQKQEPRYPYHLHEQKEIDALVYQLYGLNDEDIREVELWYCRRYPKLAEAQGLLAEVKTKYAEHLQRCDLVLARDPEYWRSNPVLELIARGEGAALEFKETLEVDSATGQRSQAVLLSALKTIAAFLNTNGGTLIIGITDAGQIAGLSRDYNLCNRHDRDGLEQKIHSLCRSRLTPFPAGKIHVNFENLEENEICVVRVEQNSGIIFLDDRDVYVREGNTTHKLEGPALAEWTRNRGNQTSSKPG